MRQTPEMDRDKTLAMLDEAGSTAWALIEDFPREFYGTNRVPVHKLYAEDIVNRFIEVRSMADNSGKRPEPRNIYIIDGSNIFYWDTTTTGDFGYKDPDWMWRRQQTKEDWDTKPWDTNPTTGQAEPNPFKTVPYELEPAARPNHSRNVRDGNTWATIPDHLKGDVIVVSSLDTIETIRTHPKEVREIIERFAGPSDKVLFIAMKPFLCDGVPAVRNTQQEWPRPISYDEGVRPCFQKMKGGKCIFHLFDQDTDEVGEHKFCEYDDVYITWIAAVLKERIAEHNFARREFPEAFDDPVQYTTNVKVITADRYLRYISRHVENTNDFDDVWGDVKDAIDEMMFFGRMRFTAHYYDFGKNWTSQPIDGRRFIVGLPRFDRPGNGSRFAPPPPPHSFPKRGFPPNPVIDETTPRVDGPPFPDLWRPSTPARPSTSGG